MKIKSLLFLDFDGVICDSLDECIISSLYAYYRLYRKKELSCLPVNYKSQFKALRPYVRHGEDYFVIQQIIEKKKHIKDQDHFDHILQKHKNKLALYKQLFYKARNILIEEESEYWFSLNKIYTHILHHLAAVCVSPFFYILSTKQADYILKILKNNNSIIQEDHVLVAWDIQKWNIIKTLLDKYKDMNAIFIDDQINHLALNRDPRINTRLAAWGYIQPDWLKREIQPITEEEMAKLLETYY